MGRSILRSYARHFDAEECHWTEVASRAGHAFSGGGAKHVFVSGGKTYEIANQDYAGLKDHTGHKVALTGEAKGDSITVSKIEMPKTDK